MATVFVGFQICDKRRLRYFIDMDSIRIDESFSGINVLEVSSEVGGGSLNYKSYTRANL